MGRYKVKLEQQAQEGDWVAVLYEDRPNEPLENLGVVACRPTRDEALEAIKEKRDRIAGLAEPEWVTLDDEVPEPQSLKAV